MLYPIGVYIVEQLIYGIGFIFPVFQVCILIATVSICVHKTYVATNHIDELL